MKPFVFESKKASLLVVALALVSFVQTVLPVALPNMPADVFTSLADLLTKLAMFYLGGQSIVDVVKALRS